MSKVDLKNAMSALNVRQPLRLQAKAPAFQSPQPTSAPTIVSDEQEQKEQVNPQTTSQSLYTEKTGSTVDPVQSEQGSNLTLSKMDPVQNEPGQKQTGSKSDPAGKREPGQRSAGFFTQVPNELLRDDGRFSDPLDFMVYLHLYSYSWGFSRETASMSQGQLEQFTGAARNTVRRSLERLTQQGWIKMVEDYECARMSRRWKVISPEQKGRKSTGSKSDPVKHEQGPELTGGGSAVTPVTGSKFDPYKESIPKEKSKNSLSLESETLRAYFSELKPQAKRESEWKALQSLRGDYSETDIADSLRLVTEQGIGETGSRCHSPMAYLAKAMGDTLAKVKAWREREELRKAKERELSEANRKQEIEAAREQEVWLEKERAFLRAFPLAEEQQAMITELCFGMPFKPLSEAGRSFASSRWSEQGDSLATMEKSND